MTDRIELVYDRLVAAEKLKSGTKYERLAAIVFRMLTEKTTVHDLRLIGEVGVPHQIDAVVGDEKKRILIEAKDYNRNVDLPIVVHFSSVVEDLRPDQAFVVTTTGFSPNAVKWAESKGLTLAVLRPPRSEADWGMLLQRIDVELRMSAPSDPTVEFQIDRSEAPRFANGQNPVAGRGDLDEMKLQDAAGNAHPLRDLIERQVDAAGLLHPAGEAGQISGTHTFKEPTWLVVPGVAPIRIGGYSWTRDYTAATREFSVGYGVGGLAAELVLRTLDGTIHRIFSNRQIQSWSFDGKNVVPSSSS